MGKSATSLSSRATAPAARYGCGEGPLDSAHRLGPETAPLRLSSGRSSKRAALLATVSSPKAMLSANVSEKRNGSCGTKPIDPRRRASGISRTSTPSTKTVPGGGSWSRASRLMSVDFPDPVTPTTATVWPASSALRRG